MLVIGIVGSPAGGKSTVATRLQELGATWINADLIARSVLDQPGVVAQLAERFGPSIVNNDGVIDRSRLADLVFGADDSKVLALKYLESLVHPQTRLIIDRRLVQLALAHCPVAILDVPLLFESRWDRVCDEVWCIDADFQLRLARAQDRGWGDEELRRREANQLPIEQKRSQATRVIDNNGSLDDLIRQVDHAYQTLAPETLPHTKHCTGAR